GGVLGVAVDRGAPVRGVVLPGAVPGGVLWWQRTEDGHQPSAVWGALAGTALGTTLILRFPLIAFAAAFVVLALFRPAASNAKLAFLGGLACVIVLQGFSNALVNDQWGYSFIHRLGAMLHPQRMAVESDGFPSAPPWH